MKYIIILISLSLCLISCKSGSSEQQTASETSFSDVINKNGKSYSFDDYLHLSEISFTEKEANSGIYEIEYTYYIDGEEQPQNANDISIGCLLLEEGGWRIHDYNPEFYFSNGKAFSERCGNEIVLYIDEEISIENNSIASLFPDNDMSGFENAIFPSGSVRYSINGYYTNDTYSILFVYNEDGSNPDYDLLNKGDISNIDQLSELFSQNNSNNALHLSSGFDGYIRFDEELNIYFYDSNYELFSESGSLTKETVNGVELWVINIPEELKQNNLVPFLTIIDDMLAVGEKYIADLSIDDKSTLYWFNSTAGDFIMAQYSSIASDNDLLRGRPPKASLLDLYQENVFSFYYNLSEYRINSLTDKDDETGLYELNRSFYKDNEETPYLTANYSDYNQHCLLLTDNGWEHTEYHEDIRVDEYGNFARKSCGNEYITFIWDVSSIEGTRISSEFPSADNDIYSDGSFPAGSEKYSTKNYYSEKTYSIEFYCGSYSECPDYDSFKEGDISNIEELSDIFSYSGGEDELYLTSGFYGYIRLDEALNVYFYNSDYEQHSNIGSLTKEVIGEVEIWLINIPEELWFDKRVAPFFTILDGKLFVGEKYNTNVSYGSNMFNKEAGEFIIDSLY